MPKINTAYTFDVQLVSQANTKLFQVNPTLAVNDVQVSIDEGAFANITTLPTISPAGGRNVKVALTSGEMNGSRIQVQFVDVAGSEWCDQVINVETSVDDLTLPNISNALLDLADGVEVGFTPRQTLRLMAAALAGKVAEVTGTFTFRNLPDTANRIVGVTSGNSRTSVTLTP